MNAAMKTVFDKATLSGIRVFFYCLLEKDRVKWNAIDFCKETGLDYESKGRKSWSDGVSNLCGLGLMEKIDGHLSWKLRK